MSSSHRCSSLQGARATRKIADAKERSEKLKNEKEEKKAKEETRDAKVCAAFLGLD